MITREEIVLIPRRFAIGKRPLSVLLGWGELTYTRLLDGNTPSPEHAIELRHLLDDPAIYARALEQGKGRVTDLAYARSFKAVDAMLESEGGAARATKIFAVADRLCELAEGDLTPSALQRLVYFAQGTMLAKTGEMLFDDLPVAAVSGPEYDRIRKVYSATEIERASKAASITASKTAIAGQNKKQGEKLAPMIASEDAAEKPAEATKTALSKAERKAVDMAYRTYGDHSGQALARMSRESAPWRKARKRAGAAPGQDCAETITPKSMRKFFSK